MLAVKLDESRKSGNHRLLVRRSRNGTIKHDGNTDAVVVLHDSVG
jgi:hypothetical protein